MAITDRAIWLSALERLALPVLTAMAERRLRAVMPVEARAGCAADRARFAHLEALGRLLAGIAPWLEGEGGSAEECGLRGRLRELARLSIAAAVDPASPDACNFSSGQQPVVDAAFLSHALLRAPVQLVAALPAATQTQLADALTATRPMVPGFNNWLLFSAMIETALAQLGRAPDLMRIDYAVRQHEQWYKGDGIYGDGPEFHFDYYNSFVIQPMLLDVLGAMGLRVENWRKFQEPVLRRAVRYAMVQERLIAPDGTFPPLGRSLTYRCGAFQLLAQIALQHHLPAELPPGQVRAALTAVMGRTLDAPGTFDGSGFLTLGLAGHQPDMAEGYICTGSVYLCATVLLPLGLPPEDPFWSASALDWTQRRIWSGQDHPVDHAID